MSTTLDWILYAVGVFAAALGATYQLANQNDGQAPHSVFKLIIGFVIAVFLTALLELLLEMYAHWNWIVVTILGLFFSLGAEHVVRLIMNYQKGAKSLWQYLKRMKQVSDLINSGKLNIDELTESDQPPTPPTPKTP